MGSILNSLNNLFVRAPAWPAACLRLIDGDGMDGVGHEGVARVRACVRPAACALGPAPCQGVQGWARGWTVDAGGRALQKIKNTKVIHYSIVQ